MLSPILTEWNKEWVRQEGELNALTNCLERTWRYVLSVCCDCRNSVGVGYSYVQVFFLNHIKC